MVGAAAGSGGYRCDGRHRTAPPRVRFCGPARVWHLQAGPIVAERSAGVRARALDCRNRGGLRWSAGGRLDPTGSTGWFDTTELAAVDGRHHTIVKKPPSV